MHAPYQILNQTNMQSIVKYLRDFICLWRKMPFLIACERPPLSKLYYRFCVCDFASSWNSLQFRNKYIESSWMLSHPLLYRANQSILWLHYIIIFLSILLILLLILEYYFDLFTHLIWKIWNLISILNVDWNKHINFTETHQLNCLFLYWDYYHVRFPWKIWHCGCLFFSLLNEKNMINYKTTTKKKG